MATLRWLPLLLVLAAGPGCEPEELVEVENHPPQAVASAPAEVLVGEVVAFDGSQSSDPDGPIASFRWDFGDGTDGVGERPSHIYGAAGTFTVTLTVADEQGATAQDQLEVLAIANLPPVAVIAAPASAQVDELVHLSGAGSSDPDGQVVAYSWLLSDGATGAGAELDHAFTSDGTFTVTLRVTDDRGATAEATHTIAVEALPPDYSGTWSWFLVDESQRDLGFLCGSFQDSTLIIASTPPSITITEQAGTTEVVYAGTISGADFAVENTTLTVTQGIRGSFSSATTFEAVYWLDPGYGSCDDRAVRGVKVQ